MSEITIEKPKVILNSVEEVIASMESRFHPENCKGLVATYQWQLKNPDHTFHVAINDGTFTLHQGTAEKPDITIECATDVYLKLVNGQMKDVIAVVTGKLRVRGSISLAQKLGRIFI